jgi:hypothetical protein
VMQNIRAIALRAASSNSWAKKPLHA